ncbi:pleckstrin (PH) domain-containing protein [Tieghemostelium lacteum]|uniref:Pleckstrin (PH) domain-containing protein n=1 Tax=Tieghemostelium lacteum TaxID=361077 RepID=A0A152A9A7_TIELA|nr:pleckstrin (PH) domain-containing protein [Tieghemostelium lacteum]|eukprot:KYR02808.1 pleckstrin (PH) domain-containing protein [Tieghemostelium lacteum]
MSWASSWTGSDQDDEKFDITKSHSNTNNLSGKNNLVQSTNSTNSINSSNGSFSPKIGDKKGSTGLPPPNHITKSGSQSTSSLSKESSSGSLLPTQPLSPSTPRDNGQSSREYNVSSIGSNSSLSSVTSSNSSKGTPTSPNTPRNEPQPKHDGYLRDRYQMVQLQQHHNVQFGNTGSDWSFMMAMDSESGKELHRSMTSMSLKYDSPSSSSPPVNGSNSSLKSSNGMGPPLKSESSSGSLNSYKSTTSSSGKLPQSPLLSPNPSSPLKTSGGMGPPPSTYMITPTSITNSPIVKKDSKTKNLDKHKKNGSNSSSVSLSLTTNTSISITSTSTFSSGVSSMNSSNGVSIIKHHSNENSANNSTSSSPISGSPITPSTTPPNKSMQVDLLGFLRKRKPSNSESPKGSPRTTNKELGMTDDSDPLSPLAEDDEEVFSLNASFNSGTDKLYEGWMEMLVSRHWKKLWFVLRVPNLEYYKGWWEDKNTTQPSEDNGKILLNYWYTFSKVSVEDGKAIFSLIQSSDVEKVGKKQDKIKFRCEDEQLAKRWIHELEDVIRKRKETTVTLRPLQANEIKTRDRRPTISSPQVYTNLQGLLPSQKLQFPQEMLDELEPDEKLCLDQVKTLLDEFPAKPLPEGETLSSYRSKRRSNDGYYRVLSMDGGGLRSVMTCILIERIVKKFPQFLDYVDIFTGTSAGSIVAAGLACEIPPKATRRVLELTALPVFGKKRFNPVNNAKFNNRVLKAGCYVFFTDKKFYEIPRKLAVPCFQLDSEYPPEAKDFAPSVRRWQPRVFHNLGPCEDYLTQDIVGDVLLRSAAAPTYFSSYQGYIDGGVFANNPGLSAISLAMSPQLDKIPSDKIICISIGTGQASHYMEGGQDYDWGLLNWAPKLGNLLIGAQVDYLTQLCDNILGEKHHRLNPPLGDQTSMDDPKLVTELATIANGIDLDETFKWIENVFLPKTR